MSGIVGICRLGPGQVTLSDLDLMVQSLIHRGPDGSGMWCQSSVGLGHLMLSYSPTEYKESSPASSVFPMEDPARGTVLTADARIDNRRALRSELGLPMRDTEQGDDGALILAAYERWGERCPERFLGDFAFALWDDRRQRLFCARDHYGVKPFYYHWDAGTFLFGSEIKSVLALPHIQPRLNEVKVADYLVPMFEDSTGTFYRDIFRLPPAHTLSVASQGIRLQEYWSLDPNREIRLASDREYAEAFRDIFEEAVSCRLYGAGPVGSMLSGGMDSSSVACMARILQGDETNVPLHTFSAIFDDVRECDERPFIDAVLGQGGFEPHYVHADQLSPLTDVNRMFSHEDEPFYAPNLFMHWALYGAAQENGVRILLDGLDGDTTVSHGLPRLIELARSGRWWSLYKETGALALNWNTSHRRLLWRRGLKPAVPGAVLRARRRLLGRETVGWQKNPTIRPDFARRIGLAERYEILESERSRPVVTVRQEHYRRLSAGILPFVLEIADRAAAAFALEARYPFFDVRLIEFCLALPSEQKLSQGWTRAVLHRAMEGILPPKVQWRGSKSNLGPNFNRGVLVGDRELVEKVLLKDCDEIASYVDIDTLRQLYARCRTCVDHKDVMTIWKAVSLALWLQHTGLSP